MSGGAIFQQALRAVGGSALGPVEQGHVLRALEAGRSGPLAFSYAAGAEAGLSREILLTRGAAVFFSFCAANLADDLADGDCTYLEAPTRTGPTVQFILQSFAFAMLARGAVPPDVIARAGADLVAAGGAQLIELRTTTWTATTAREVAEGIAGLQYAAYLRILWAGTPLEPAAPRAGRALGIAAHVAQDLTSGDPRIHSLAQGDRREVMLWARDLAIALRKENLRCIDAALGAIEPTLQAAL
ncbi:hypothetical protein WME99_44375 [Sorangium sp. So ce136]|uniref:hypothetical protein n=1 Tax=Sorangium sp. So ce136 TaxID=3133284 RepID=UPI003F078BA0